MSMPTAPTKAKKPVARAADLLAPPAPKPEPPTPTPRRVSMVEGPGSDHDLARVMKDLNEALSQDKRHVAILIGAGCPAAIRVPAGDGTQPLIPDIAGLTQKVAHGLKDDGAFKALSAQFTEDGVTPNIEQMLTQVRTLQRIVGAGSARGIDRAGLNALEQAICGAVYDATCAPLPRLDTPYHRLAQWIRDVERRVPVCLFTTNYDLLMEQALEEEEVPFFDGFSGTRKPFFDIRAMESDALPKRWTRLWKLHGSINWRKHDANGATVVRSMEPQTDGKGLLIHPSELKYDQSRRMPYLAMFDRLRAFLREPGAILVTAGYSFADEHLNETIIQGLNSNAGATAFALFYKNLDEEPGARSLLPRAAPNLSLLARDRAVIRRRAALWSDISLLGSADPTAGRGVEFNLGDFAKFGDFVAALAGTKPPSTATEA